MSIENFEFFELGRSWEHYPQLYFGSVNVYVRRDIEAKTLIL